MYICVIVLLKLLVNSFNKIHPIAKYKCKVVYILQVLRDGLDDIEPGETGLCINIG